MRKSNRADAFVSPPRIRRRSMPCIASYDSRSPSITPAIRWRSLHLRSSLVGVTPQPALTRFKGTDHRVLHAVEMFGGVLVLRRVAASHVAALQAESQMHPRVSR